MLYIIAVETDDLDEIGDAFDNDIEDLTNWINDWIPQTARVRPLSEVVSC